jgi:hypothetical protein
MKDKETSKTQVSFSDLYAMYNFANSFNITKLSGDMKALVKVKVAELENEILTRLFEINPFKNQPTETTIITGRDPIQVLQAMSDDTKTFVVVSPKENTEGK